MTVSSKEDIQTDHWASAQ